jgi:hypothetical protein
LFGPSNGLKGIDHRNSDSSVILLEIDFVKIMKNKTVTHLMLVFMLMAATFAVAAPKAPTANAPQNIPAFPGTLVNARYVYVTSYDGDQFDPNVLPEDRHAIATVQNAMEKWGKFIIVYEPRQADIVMMVTSRPSEDVLAVYDARGWPANGQYLWRMMGRDGLQPSESPLVTNLEKAFDLATAARK